MRQFFSRFSRRTWIIIGVVAVILLFVGISFARPNKEVTFQTLLAERGDLAAYVGATGSVRAKQTATLTWQTNGIVGDVNAEIGERV